MKTIEEKAKAYDEIIGRAKKELDACGSQDCDAAKQIFRLFPELKESEDEKIRKDLIRYLQLEKYGSKILPGSDEYSYEEVIAWLEKQGEKTPIVLPQGFFYVDQDGNKYYSKEFRYNNGYNNMTFKVGKETGKNDYE